MPNYRRALVPGGCWFFTAICAIVQPTCWPAHLMEAWLRNGAIKLRPTALRARAIDRPLENAQIIAHKRRHSCPSRLSIQTGALLLPGWNERVGLFGKAETTMSSSIRRDPAA